MSRAARVKHHRTIGVIGMAGLGLVILVAVGATKATARHDTAPADSPARSTSVPAPTGETATPAAALVPVDSPAVAVAAAPLWAPVVAEGQSALRDGVLASRSGSSVTVHFDLPNARTRRRDKFERIVRTTLPQVYGPAADSLLASIPAGDLARAGDVLVDLPTRGLRLALPAGQTLTLWPETRPGRDGPLVVSYRSTVTR